MILYLNRLTPGSGRVSFAVCAIEELLQVTLFASWSINKTVQQADLPLSKVIILQSINNRKNNYSNIKIAQTSNKPLQQWVHNCAN